MNEILTQQELDALLSGVKKTVTGKSKKIKRYDFKHPDKFSKDHIRTLQMLHENLARLWSSSMSAHLRAQVHIEVVSLEQTSYEEFVNSLPNPTVFAAISLEPLHGHMIWELSPDISISIVERLLGGLGDFTDHLRQLTEIELTVIENMIEKLTPDIHTAWINMLSVKPELVSIESNPQYSHIAPPTEMVVAVSMEMTLNGKVGSMNICLPYTLLEHAIPRLSAQYWFATDKKGNDESAMRQIKDLLKPTLFELTLELGKVDISVNQVLDMEVGDVLTLETQISAPLVVKINGKRKFIGKPGLLGKKLGVEILDVVLDGGKQNE
ncbi:MAG: flagellar motor switch protein FliM [Firmicutes bacterium]|nr:flagellar motor switch protein FliM [Bacillota bacterium]MDD4263577.1 flagellar motor switch protein FliM [Bacillota bacterium]MDD4694438.1 flagellar motor switch protein FliM [Bacillota bacterium]